MNLMIDFNFHKKYKDTKAYQDLFNTPYDQPPEDHPCHGEDQGLRKPDQFFCVSCNFYMYLKERNYLVGCIMGNYIWGYEKNTLDSKLPEDIVKDYYDHIYKNKARPPLWIP